MIKTAIVNSKDLFDKKKNPKLSLSPQEILKNDKIKKTITKKDKGTPYYCEFAPDGSHWVRNKTVVGIERAWAYLISKEVVIQKALNKQCKFRVINSKTGDIIGDKYN